MHTQVQNKFTIFIWAAQIFKVQIFVVAKCMDLFVNHPLLMTQFFCTYALKKNEECGNESQLQTWPLCHCVGFLFLQIGRDHLMKGTKFMQ